MCQRASFLTHFGVSVAMDNHWQRVVRRVSNSHSARSKLEKHLICQEVEHETFKARLWKLTHHMGKKLWSLLICKIGCQEQTKICKLWQECGSKTACCWNKSVQWRLCDNPIFIFHKNPGFWNTEFKISNKLKRKLIYEIHWLWFLTNCPV